MSPEALLAARGAVALPPVARVNGAHPPTRAAAAPKPTPPPAGAAPRIWTAGDLLAQSFPAIRYVVRELLPQGYAILAGAPKLGKSWLAYQIAAAVAEGRDLFAQATDRGEVLLLALEDGERRVQDRLLKVLDNRAAPAGLSIATAWPRIGDGGLEQMQAWASRTPSARLVIVDTFAKLKPPSSRNVNAYDADYALHGQLHAFATASKLAVLAITHYRKGAAGGDFVEAVTGSAGITGAADTILAMERARGSEDAVLHVTGRDIRESKLAIRLENGIWRCLGDAASVLEGETRQKLSRIVAEASEPLTAGEIAELAELKADTARRTLNRMVRDQRIVRSGNRYAARIG
ncbi:DNA repair protein RadA [Falsiroseomonas bella]|uniref:DNA repair protein RadA n=1 Tax=Falsiroseomonas bella TaxID=2184016 RepID=A0A317FHD4_9PROT|nr:AAA family ATPase [Falsiroseomonas bella]PWS37782.1 DNA repair protein RadA [Falsiroseomonas bella]